MRETQAEYRGRVDRFEVLGVPVSAADTVIAIAEIDRWISAKAFVDT